jgi:hypothetical protein
VLLALPAPWVMGTLAAAIAVTIVGPLLRSAARRRAARRAGPVDGVVLGTNERGRPVHLLQSQLAAHGLIVGASGAGKSTTMLAILGDAIRRGQPVLAIDLKGSPSFAQELQRAAASVGRPFSIWTPDGPAHWNPLASGNATALKDKLIAAERFTEPHYQRAAERYVQTVFQVLDAVQLGAPPQLDEVVALMDPRRLHALSRELRGPLSARVDDYLTGLTSDQLSAIHGLGTRLAILSESHAGPFLRSAPPGGHTIDLARVLAGDEVAVFSLNSSLYGKLTAQLGTIIVQDLITNVGQRLQETRGPVPQAVVGVDEFSAIGSDNLLALLARGREAGVAGLLATQEVADLERAAPGFRDQVLGITALKLVHRQDVPSSARLVADMIGTQRVWEETRTIPGSFGQRVPVRGTRRLVERPVIDPNEIKTLPTGRLIMLTKAPVAAVRRVDVRPLAHLVTPAPVVVPRPPPSRTPAPPPARAALPAPRSVTRPALPPPRPAPRRPGREPGR